MDEDDFSSALLCSLDESWESFINSFTDSDLNDSDNIIYWMLDIAK